MKYAIFSKKKDDLSLSIVSYIKDNVKYEYDEENPDLLITIGGDGTILRGVNKYTNRLDNLIIFGINTGHLGFYSNWKKDNIELMCKMINENKFEIEEHSLLEWETSEASGLAMNEITIINPTATQILDVYIDGIKFETIRGTGICISTTNGSTAYNKSIGGPVVDHNLNCFIVSEVASINSNAYRSLNSPIVLSSNHVLELTFSNAPYLTSDHLKYELNNNDSVKCKLSSKKIKFGCEKTDLFLERIKKAFL